MERFFIYPAYNKKQWYLAYLLLSFLLILSSWQAFYINQSLEVKILNIGQGDSILIQTPAHKNILIDAGVDTQVIDQLGKELPFFNRTIDLFILTHSHFDHYGGFLEIIEKYKIKAVAINGADSSSFLYQYFITKIKEKNIPIHIINSGQDVQISPSIYLDFLFPIKGKSIIGQIVHNKNNVSIVSRLIQRNNNQQNPLFIFTGDAEIEEEQELLLSPQKLSASHLKVGHHGSRTATSLDFLRAINPKIASISCGINNSFKHPHPETIQVLNGHNITTYITSEMGTIVFTF